MFDVHETHSAELLSLLYVPTAHASHVVFAATTVYPESHSQSVINVLTAGLELKLGHLSMYWQLPASLLKRPATQC